MPKTARKMTTAIAAAFLVVLAGNVSAQTFGDDDNLGNWADQLQSPEYPSSGQPPGYQTQELQEPTLRVPRDDPNLGNWADQLQSPEYPSTSGDNPDGGSDNPFNHLELDF